MNVEAPAGAPTTDLGRVDITGKPTTSGSTVRGPTRRRYDGEALDHWQGRRRVLGTGEIDPNDVEPAWRRLVEALGRGEAVHFVARLARRAGWTVEP